MMLGVELVVATVIPLTRLVALKLVKPEPLPVNIPVAVTLVAVTLPVTAWFPVNELPEPSKANAEELNPPNWLAFRLGTTVVEAMERGAVPVATVEINWPAVLRFPVAFSAASNFAVPFTSKVVPGAVVPMPTLPALVMRIHSFSTPLLVRNLTDDPLVSEAKKNPLESCPSRPAVAPAMAY